MAENKKFIVDASFIAVAIGLTACGESAQKYIKLVIQNKTSLLAPTLLFYEINNVINQQLKTRKIDRTAFIEIFEQFGIRLLPISDTTKTHEIAQKYKLSFYDASYIALLQETNADLFLTFDQDFKKVKSKVKILQIG